MQISMKQKKYLDDQFQNLENSSFQKYKLLEIKNTVNRIENHELAEFCEKMKKMYKKETEQKEPSLKDMIKWVKNMVTHKGKEEEEAQNVRPALKKQEETTKASWAFKPK